MKKLQPLKVLAATLCLAAGTLSSVTATQAACSEIPTDPSIKTIWEETGQPRFEITTAKQGFPARDIFYSFSTYDREKRTWSDWTDWVSVGAGAANSGYLVSPNVELSEDLIEFEAYAGNTCGNSTGEKVSRTLQPFYEWRPTDLNIAKDIPLSVGKISTETLVGSGKYIPFSFTSSSEEICRFEEAQLILKNFGMCQLTISLNNSGLKTPGSDLKVDFNVLKSPEVLPVAFKDRKDDISGFQIHPIYVTVKGVDPGNYDKNGYVNDWLDLTNAWMKRKLGKEFIFDTFQGAYDVTRLESRYTVQDLRFDGEAYKKAGPLEKLKNEFTIQNGKPLLGKNLLFIVDGEISSQFCGLANEPGNLSLAIARGTGCWEGPEDFLGVKSKFSEVSDTIAHELIHNLGVDHTCVNPSDLMVGRGCPESFFSKVTLEKTLDITKSMYVGAEKAGANILDLKVWRDGSGKRHIAVDGLCYVGEPCEIYSGTFTNLSGPLQLQQLSQGKWKTVASPKGVKAGKKTHFNIEVNPSTKGMHTYRLFISETKGYRAFEGKPIKVNVIY